MNDVVDKVSGRTGKLAGKPDKDVDEIRTSSQGKYKRPGGAVVYTELARLLRNINVELHKVPVVDRKKVERTRYRIDNGEYRINAHRIAKKILETETLLG